LAVLQSFLAKTSILKDKTGFLSCQVKWTKPKAELLFTALQMIHLQ